MSKNNNDSIKRTGELLLSGWKMLNKACPICNTALLSKGDNLRCPTCDCAVVTEANQATMQNVSQSGQKNSDSAIEQKFDIEDDYYQYASSGKVQHESLEEQKKEYDAKHKARNNEVSDKLGAKMLAGWSMLSTICPEHGCRGTPLMRLASGPMLCVACDTEYKVSALGDLVKSAPAPSASGTTSAQPSKAAPAVTTKATPAPAPGASAALVVSPSATPSATVDPSFFLDMNNAPILDLGKFSRNVDDASSKISRRMMQGWALLDKCCYSKECRGEVPLMRDLDGQECCVQCGFPNIPVVSSSTHHNSHLNTHIHPSVVPRDAEDSCYSSDSDSDCGPNSSIDPVLQRQEQRAANERTAQKNAQTSGQKSGVSLNSKNRCTVEPADLSDDDSVADQLLFESFQQMRVEQDQKRAASTTAAAASTSAAIAPVQKASKASAAPQHPRSAPAGKAPVSSTAGCQQDKTQKYRCTTGITHSTVAAESSGNNVSVPLQILHQKLHEAAEQLESSTHLETSMKLADLIAKLGAAIHALQSL